MRRLPHRFSLALLTAFAFALSAPSAAAAAVPETETPLVANSPLAPTPLLAAGAPLLADVDPLVADLQERTFRWFWDTAHPQTGLIPDRWPSPSFSSVAAVGFGISAYVVGADRGWVSRADAAARTRQVLQFLYDAPQGTQADAAGHKGFFYHFLNMETGRRIGDVELSTVDTALLIAGALTAAMYFDGGSADEWYVRDLATRLYRRVEWTWAQPRPPLISLGWKPGSGFLPYDYGGYNETMLLYVLALGSPTYPIDAAAWSAYTAGYDWRTYYGYAHVNFGPLFGHQYSHTWIDFRGIQDAYMRGRGIDYFTNSKRATLAQRKYAIANPGGFTGYGGEVWGLTACDGPANITRYVNGRNVTFHSYWARAASATEVRDDGTIAPTAAAASIPFTPNASTRAIKAMRNRYGQGLWGQYGFFDAFNPTFRFTDVRLDHGRVIPGLGWFDTDYLGIDQGPIVLMIENHRSDLIWGLMRRQGDLRRGLERAGFSGGWLGPARVAAPETAVETAKEDAATDAVLRLTAAPNPAAGPADIAFSLPEAGAVRLSVVDVLGREVAVLADGVLPAGAHRRTWDGAAGTYVVRLETEGAVATRRVTRLQR